VKDTYAQFNIGVTDVDPCPDPNAACTVSHWEAMAAGLPTQVGMSNGVAGVSPFTCGVIPNAITYSFLNLSPSDVNDACWTIAQESAHAFGLSHEMLAADPMTYITAPSRKHFTDQSACIGTQGCCSPSQECQCGPTMQNSVQAILAVFGTSAPTPPMITINNPADHSTVGAGFPISATVTDDQGIAKVELLIDGVATATLTSGPFAFNAPRTVMPGSHTVTIKGTDNLGSEGMAQITVTVADPCHSNSDCSGQGTNLVCADGQCVPGPDVMGGLGDTCTDHAQCLSNQCVSGSEGTVCTSPCNPTSANSCPDGFRCASSSANPSDGFCYPSASGAGCFGCSTDGGTDPTLPLGVGVVAAALMIRRRRRSA
jgi:MYXO-CTERM domain-containing protein